MRHKGPKKSWKTVPLPQQLVFTPKAFGSQVPNEQRYQRARKESLKIKEGGMVEEKMSH